MCLICSEATRQKASLTLVAFFRLAPAWFPVPLNASLLPAGDAWSRREMVGPFSLSTFPQEPPPVPIITSRPLLVPHPPGPTEPVNATEHLLLSPWLMGWRWMQRSHLGGLRPNLVQENFFFFFGQGRGLAAGKGGGLYTVISKWENFLQNSDLPASFEILADSAH